MTHIDSKTVGFLGLAAVIAIVAAVALNRARQPATEEARTAAYLVPELRGHVNDVKAVTITGAEDRVLVTLMTDGQGWRVKEKSDYPADIGKLRELLLKLADAALLEPKTANEQRYADLGVDEPTGKEAKRVRITLDGLGKPIQVIIGNTSSRGEGTFVRQAGEKQSWLAKGELTVEKEPGQWLEQTLADIPAARIREVVVRHPDGRVVRVYKEQSGDANFRLADIPKGRTLTSEAAPNSLAGVLAGLKLEDVAARKESDIPGDGKTYKARYTTFEGVVLGVEAWKKDDKAYARLSAQLDASLADAHVAAEQAKAKAEYESQQKARAAQQAQTQGDAAAKAIDDKAQPLTPPLAVADPATDRRQRLDQVNAEVATLTTRFSGWTFVLPAFKFGELDKTVDDFLKPAGGTARPGAKRAAKPRK